MTDDRISEIAALYREMASFWHNVWKDENLPELRRIHALEKCKKLSEKAAKIEKEISDGTLI
jgi:hypothetical protein